MTLHPQEHCYMKKALTIEEMLHLKDLGVPMEKACRGYERTLVPVNDNMERPLNPFPDIPGYVWCQWKLLEMHRTWQGNRCIQNIPAFTVEDMFRLLPQVVDVNFRLQLASTSDGRWRAFYHTGLDCEADDLLDALHGLFLKYLDYNKEKYGSHGQ